MERHTASNTVILVKVLRYLFVKAFLQRRPKAELPCLMRRFISSVIDVLFEIAMVKYTKSFVFAKEAS